MNLNEITIIVINIIYLLFFFFQKWYSNPTVIILRQISIRKVSLCMSIRVAISFCANARVQLWKSVHVNVCMTWQENKKLMGV